MYRVAAIPGDGIGPEVIDAAIETMQRTSAITGVGLDVTTYPWSSQQYRDTGVFIPDDGMLRVKNSDAVLFGAHGDPAVADVLAARGLVFRLRHELDLYVNLRPIRLLRGVRSALRDVESRIDFVVVRENLEGEMVGHGGVSGGDSPAGVATDLTVVTRHGTERVARFAFELARHRSSHLTLVTKSNAIPHALGYWDRVVLEVAEQFPDVRVEKLYVDAAAAAMVGRPHTFDVVLCTSLHGDILSDLGAALVGGLGLAPSANLNPERTSPSVFEPIHGSAPDIAGKGIANPIAAILSGAMLFDHLGETSSGDIIRAAVDEVLEKGIVRTRDLGGTSTTAAVTDAVCEAINPQMALERADRST